MVDAVSNSLTIDHYMAESLDYVTMKLPVIYLLDCTLNDCDLILKSVNQVLLELCFLVLHALSCLSIHHLLLSHTHYN